MISKDFFMAGKAIFTVDNGEGKHYTYKVEHKIANAQGAEAVFYKLLTPNGYIYMGYAGNGALNPPWCLTTTKSRMRNNCVAMRVINCVVSAVWDRRQLPKRWTVAHEGKCGMCARLLTNPESIRVGLGPICAGKV